MMDRVLCGEGAADLIHHLIEQDKAHQVQLQEEKPYAARGRSVFADNYTQAHAKKKLEQRRAKNRAARKARRANRNGGK